MPDRMHMIDTGCPNFSGYEKTEETVEAIQNYLFMLLEELRFLLRNLDADNFNDAGLADFAEKLAAALEKNPVFDSVVTNILYSNTVVTGELYADYGDIADLTVWKLRTDWSRAQKYLRGDTSDINYVTIHDEQIDFITATPETPLRTIQLYRDPSTPCWWADDTRTRITVMEDTGIPVKVYAYRELTKLSIRFQTITLTNGTTTYAPVITLGAGDENGRSKGFIYKRQNDLLIRYLTSSGEYTDISLNDFVDAKHRRLKSCAINKSAGRVNYTVEGDSTAYQLSFSVSGSTAAFTWPDGHTCEVSIS